MVNVDAIELFDADAIQNPYPLYERMRAAAPVHRIGDSGFYAACTWAAVHEAVARTEDFSSNLVATMRYTREGDVVPFQMAPLGAPTHVLATADDPAHAAHRKQIVPQLAAKRIHSIERFARDTADDIWATNLVAGRIEWMSAVANKLPMMVVARLIGVPSDDVGRLERWGSAGTQLLEGLLSEDELNAAGITALEMMAYLDENLTLAAADPQDNLLGDLATACASDELDRLTAQVIMGTLFSAGGESTSSLLGSAAHVLAAHSAAQEQLRASPELLGAFIEEALRYEPPFRGHYRHVMHDTTLQGVDIPAGSNLLLLWGSANRDPLQYEDPDTFRLDRPRNKNHMTFGKGAHLCVGAALARLEAQIVFDMLLKRTSWIEIDAVGNWLPSLLVRRLERLELDVAC
ncbi:cytochrome [Mycobacterium paraffinicum]|uniref:Cytochrome n=1 Tax=Mycobacterium paraffinicum TaxID=53378 RepID=A0A1Q4I2Q7_9MYCO|nr:cytochrome P450 [Mycobacterium paraffinicum]OJZ76146.1 cytochrome [Mycobacterium paraffinicum]